MGFFSPKRVLMIEVFARSIALSMTVCIYLVAGLPGLIITCMILLTAGTYSGRS